MKKGFTLLELLIVVIIIGVLATFAVPQYLTAVERARLGKAKNAMGLISKAEKMRAAENNGNYIASTDANLGTTLGSYIEMNEISGADTLWDYVVTCPTASTFLITATRTGGSNNGEYITLTNLGVWDETHFTP